MRSDVFCSSFGTFLASSWRPDASAWPFDVVCLTWVPLGVRVTTWRSCLSLTRSDPFADRLDTPWRRRHCLTLLTRPHKCWSARCQVSCTRSTPPHAQRARHHPVAVGTRLGAWEVLVGLGMHQVHHRRLFWLLADRLR